jgi:hypothetical protein
VEHNGLLVCEGCGLVLAPVYEPPKFKPADSSFNVFNGAPRISSGGLAQRALEALAEELDIPAGAVLEVYKRLRRYAGVGEAAAIALFVTAKRSGTYVSLKRACELLSKCGVKAEYPRAVRAMLAYAPPNPPHGGRGAGSLRCKARNQRERKARGAGDYREG